MLIYAQMQAHLHKLPELVEVVPQQTLHGHCLFATQHKLGQVLLVTPRLLSALKYNNKHNDWSDTLQSHAIYVYCYLLVQSCTQLSQHRIREFDRRWK